MPLTAARTFPLGGKLKREIEIGQQQKKENNKRKRVWHYVKLATI